MSERHPRDLRDPRAFRWVESGISGLAPPREWDAVATAECAAAGEECSFVALRDGRTVAVEGDAEAVACATRALEGEVDPPYRAVGRRRDASTWAVAALGIEVAELPADIDGEEVTLVVGEDGSRSLTVDGRPALAGLEALEQLAGGRFRAFVLRGSRLEGRLWELKTDPL